MRFIFASDIHGSAYWCRKLLVAFAREEASRLVLLGDLLYHGPRNNMPEGYDTKEVAEMLNSHKDKILCVRGNCDSQVDQMVLDFPIMADYAVLTMDDTAIYCTHGHIYNDVTPPPLVSGDIIMCGHTHIPDCRHFQKYVYMNPGSVSLPKKKSHHGYILAEDGVFVWKDMDGEIINEFNERETEAD